MEQFLEFFGNHPILFLAFFAILGTLVWTMIGAGGGGRKVSVMDATRLINHEDAIVLDVRAEGEFKGGHIVNALHIPLTYLNDQVDKLEKYRDRPIIAVCRTGSQQTGKACATLRKHGFERVYSLSGGMLAWQDANLPVTRK